MVPVTRRDPHNHGGVAALEPTWFGTTRSGMTARKCATSRQLAVAIVTAADPYSMPSDVSVLEHLVLVAEVEPAAGFAVVLRVVSIDVVPGWGLGR